MRSASFFAILVFALPFSAAAQVVVSEIMYDLESGSDSGREWIEVFNGGSGAVNLTEWRLFENGSNHTLSSVSGGDVLVSGGYAVIADNTSKFLEDYPGYSGALFDSAFSLSNTGEALTLRCCASGDMLDKDSVSYAAEWGASGDGTSLHRTSSGSFIAGTPTPGSGNLAASSGASEEHAAPSGGGGDTPSATVLSLSVEGGSDRYVISGAATPFYALVLDEKKKEASNVHIEWNFGDGTVEVGARTSHAFAYPGRYAVSVSASHYDKRALDSFVVIVEEAKFALSPFPDGSIAVENRSSRDVEVSGWKLSDGMASFQFPPNTRILSEASLRIPKETLKFFASERVGLHYHDGTPVPLLAEEPPAVSEEDAPSPAPARLVVSSASLLYSEEEGTTTEEHSEPAPLPLAQSASAAFFWRVDPYVIGATGVVLLGAGIAFALSRARNEWTIIEESSDGA